MRVLFVCTGFPPGARGGTEIHAWQLARALIALGHDIAVFCREGDPTRPDYDERDDVVDGVPVHRVKYDFGDATTLAWIHDNPQIDAAFVRVLDRFRPDVVHIHHLTCLSTGIIDRAREAGVGIVMALHDFWMVCSRGQRIREELEICTDLDRSRCVPCLQRLWPHFDVTLEALAGIDELLKRRLGACHVLIAASAFHRERMLEFGVDPARIHVVEHGLDSLARVRARRPHDGVRRIGYIGSVIPTKGVHILVEAFNRLARRDLELVIHGEAPQFHGDDGYPGRLRELAHPWLNVQMPGAYDPSALAEILGEIDLLVVPSLWWESFCLTIREAFLAGIPVVASDIGAMGEAFADGRGGRHFRAGDPGDLHRVLLELVDHPPALAALAATIPAVRTVADCARETAGWYARALVDAKAAPAAPATPGRTGARDGRPYATVFIPTWNGGPLFAEILDRVLAQETTFDFEVLVIDSGSRDGTVDAVKARPRVRLIEIPNTEFNHGLTRNRAVREARGEVVALLTQDAEPLDRHWLERLVSNFDDPRVAGAYCHQQPRPDCNPFQRDRLRGWTKESGSPEVKELPAGARFSDLHPYDRYKLIAFDDVASCVRKSVMDLIPYERRQFGEDIAWGRQAILAGWRIVNDPGAVVIHSHNSPVLYEFRRVYLDHQNIHELVGLHTVPRWWMVPLFSVKALLHLAPVVWRDDRGLGYRLWWLLKLPLYAFTQNLAQYLGAKSVAWKRAGRAGWFDRRMRRGV